jgi:hypothetical protein
MRFYESAETEDSAVTVYEMREVSRVSEASEEGEAPWPLMCSPR